MPNTTIADLIDSQVMADMISAKISQKIVVAPFATIDNKLVGVPGDTITVPQYAYIGDAEDVAEGVECGSVKLTASSTNVKVKKAMKGIILTDEAVLSGYGNPIGEANNQLALSISSKVDVDAMSALQTAQLAFDGSAKAISYEQIVDAVDIFEEEFNSEKVIFINPHQVTTLRKDANFISADKYQSGVILTGEIGMIANCRVVSSKKVPLDETSAFYKCPIVKLNSDTDTEDDTSAITIYLKRDTNVETERHTGARTTEVTADKIYAAALSNTSKVVLAKFKK